VDLPLASISPLGAFLFAVLGLVLLALHVFPGSRKRPSPRRNEIDDLIARIKRGLRSLASPVQAGGLGYRANQEEVGSLLAELQSRLRLAEDVSRHRYEARVSQIFVEAARAGITVPPLEMPLDTHQASR
jgi:hypothetical protein